MTTTYNQQLGPLRSEITFTLHTQYATRLWNGIDYLHYVYVVVLFNCFYHF